MVYLYWVNWIVVVAWVGVISHRFSTDSRDWTATPSGTKLHSMNAESGPSSFAYWVDQNASLPSYPSSRWPVWRKSKSRGLDWFWLKSPQSCTLISANGWYPFHSSVAIGAANYAEWHDMLAMTCIALYMTWFLVIKACEMKGVLSAPSSLLHNCAVCLQWHSCAIQCTSIAGDSRRIIIVDSLFFADFSHSCSFPYEKALQFQSSAIAVWSEAMAMHVAWFWDVGSRTC